MFFFSLKEYSENFVYALSHSWFQKNTLVFFFLVHVALLDSLPSIKITFILRFSLALLRKKNELDTVWKVIIFKHVVLEGPYYNSRG